MDKKGNLVVARFADGKVIKGLTYDFNPNKKIFHIAALPQERAEQVTEITLTELKALFFVDTLEGNNHHALTRDFSGLERTSHSSIKVKVTFHDGEWMLGTTVAFNRDREGFFMTPVDRENNNKRVFVIFNAVEKFETWK